MHAAAIGIAAVLTLLMSLLALRYVSRDHVVVVGFWFEDLMFEVDGYSPDAWGGALTAEERAQIETVAGSELAAAFAGLRIRISDSRSAMYRVRVVQQLERYSFSPFRTSFGAAGESRSAWPLGGRGAVGFGVLAGNALAYAPLPWHRGTIVEGIGRGIGRAAAHEFAHQFFPTASIDSRADIGSYEYVSAWRAEQYYGSMHWTRAWPHLVRRFGPIDHSRESRRAGDEDQ